jgi:uncharacterized membrane protein YczE
MNYGMGTALYICADAGIGPRDSMMVGLHKKFGIRNGLARTILDVLVVCLGFLLSGPIGIGTVIFSLTIGFFVEKSSKFLKKFKILQFESVEHKNNPVSSLTRPTLSYDLEIKKAGLVPTFTWRRQKS